MINKKSKIKSFDEYIARYFPTSDLTLLLDDHPEKIGASLAKVSLNVIKEKLKKIHTTRRSS